MEITAENAFHSIYAGERGSVPESEMNTVVGAMKRDSYAKVNTGNDDDGKGVPLEPKLGLLWGVYLPCVQNILGVILFIRLPWIAAQAGLPLTTLIVLMCVLSTFVTSLSLSAIATNGTISLCF